MASPIWIRNLIKRTFSQRFFLSRLTRVPPVGRLLDKALFDGDDLIILPKNDVIQVNRALESPEDTVLPSRVVEHFIKEAHYHWIMDACICRESSHCKDYPVDLGCLFLGKATQGINPKFGRPVSAEEALLHVERCREAGLVHLVGRNKLDSVWLNVRPGNELFTICNCCPCCCLWKVLPHMSTRISSKVTKMPGVSVFVTGQCIGCGTCTKNICFANAIRLEGDRAVIGNGCRGCGRCVESCPQNAIHIRITDESFVSRTIGRLSDLVDVSQR